MSIYLDYKQQVRSEKCCFGAKVRSEKCCFGTKVRSEKCVMCKKASVFQCFFNFYRKIGEVGLVNCIIVYFFYYDYVFLIKDLVM